MASGTTSKISKLLTDFKKAKDECANLVEENKNLKQEIQVLKEKLQEKDKQIQERDEEFEKLQQHVQNLEKQRSEELLQLQELEMISQDFQNELGLLELDETKKNDIKVEENNEQQNYDSNNSTSFPSVDQNKKNNKQKSLEEDNSNIQVIVGLDFGTTYSGFTCCHVSNEESDSPDNLKPKLPVEYKKAITDYFTEISKVIKKVVQNRRVGIDFFENVLLVLTVPMGFSEKDKDIMRECVHDAKLIRNISSKKLQFITESEAAALYCIKNELREHDLLTTGNSFMVVDCVGYTVDLSTCKLVGNNPLQLGKVTEYIRDFCGSIEKQVIKCLRDYFGNRGIDLLIEVKYQEFQSLVRFFSRQLYSSLGRNAESFDIIVKEYAPSLERYVSKNERKYISRTINFMPNNIKNLLNPIIDRIIRLIHIQISNSRETCSGIFLVGGFSENKYLQEKIKQEFYHKVKTISVPHIPITVIADGAVIHGLSISSNLDKLEDNTKSTEVTSDQVFSFNFKPEKWQANIKFEVYYTNEDSAIYINEPGMKLLGVLNADLPDYYIDNRSIDFGLIFGQNEITAFARNELNGQKFVTTFYYQ
ncbi:hypothetical protein RhiirA5_459488 [Rhizophagus irregularis]|uniref:Hsp70 family protein n=1 Tax=Rhizophagus irregularis TaxID=588596 RepID=A0A2N0P092_9GLOM|nr:hypothetical protein RhiirA5_459488 [Rhizophagus irregularis]